MRQSGDSDEVCFVIMPFTVKDYDRATYDDPNHWNEVYEGLIVPAIQSASLRCERDDEDSGSRFIVEGVLEKIESARLVLCDLSSHNPNVFLELGWALRADKPFVLIKDDLTNFTFDLNQAHTFQYAHSLKPSTLRVGIQELAAVISRTLEDSDRRYSLVAKMGISLSAIKAVDDGNIIAQMLMSIRDQLSSLKLSSPIGSDPAPIAFPWPKLIEPAVEMMYLAKSGIEQLQELTPGTIGSVIRATYRAMANYLERVFQISVMDEKRRFVYHDWKSLVGSPASLPCVESIELVDQVYRLPFGVISWSDRASNVERFPQPTFRRDSIGIFCVTNDGLHRILVEIHVEAR